MENGFITEITDANTAEGANSFDGTGLYVSSGWIDMHVHAVAKLEPYGDAIDEIGVKQGVATIIDAGAAARIRLENWQPRLQGPRRMCLLF